MRILLIILIFCSFGAMAQPINYQGNINSISGFKGGLLADLDYYFPQYKTIGVDTALVGVDSSVRGKGFRVPMSTIKRWAVSAVTIPGLQAVLSSNSDLNIDNTIRSLSNTLTFRLFKFIIRADTSFWEGQPYVVNNPIVYDPMVVITQPNHVVTKQYVDNLATQSSFDTTLPVQTSIISSTRFTVPVKTINYGGLTWNSYYFTQVGTTVTMNAIIFYPGQKLNISF